MLCQFIAFFYLKYTHVFFSVSFPLYTTPTIPSQKADSTSEKSSSKRGRSKKVQIQENSQKKLDKGTKSEPKNKPKKKTEHYRNSKTKVTLKENNETSNSEDTSSEDERKKKTEKNKKKGTERQTTSIKSETKLPIPSEYEDSETSKSDTSSNSSSDDSTYKKSSKSSKTPQISKKLFEAFSRSNNSSNNNEEYSLRFKFVISKGNGVKDFAYVSLESDNDVSIWLSSLYMANIMRVYGDIYMKESDKFRDSIMSAQSLKRRATPYGENEPLQSRSSKLNKSFDVYGLFFTIPIKSTNAFIKLFKKIMISDEMKETVTAWKDHQKQIGIEPNQLSEALTSFESNTWKYITKSCQKDFENARSEEHSLDALILDYDIKNILRKMYDYKGDNFTTIKDIKNTGWNKATSKANYEIKKVKTEK